MGNRPVKDKKITRSFTLPRSLDDKLEIFVDYYQTRDVSDLIVKCLIELNKNYSNNNGSNSYNINDGGGSISNDMIQNVTTQKHKSIDQILFEVNEKLFGFLEDHKDGLRSNDYLRIMTELMKWHTSTKKMFGEAKTSDQLTTKAIENMNPNELVERLTSSQRPELMNSLVNSRRATTTTSASDNATTTNKKPPTQRQTYETISPFTMSTKGSNDDGSNDDGSNDDEDDSIIDEPVEDEGIATEEEEEQEED